MDVVFGSGCCHDDVDFPDVDIVLGVVVLVIILIVADLLSLLLVLLFLLRICCCCGRLFGTKGIESETTMVLARC